MVRNRADEAVQKLPKAYGGSEPRMNKELNNVVENAETYRKDLRDDFLSVEHLLLAMNGRLDVGSEELLQVLKRRARLAPRHRPEPGGQVRRAREVRPGPHRPRRRGQDRPGHRPRRGDPPLHPGAVAAHQEQPGADRRAGRRQDGHRRGPRGAHRRRRRARGPEGQAADRARHRVDARRRQVPRRVRGAAQGRPQGDHRRRRRGHHVRRRAAHDRRRRWRRGCDGRRQHDQADARPRRAADDRRHHARRVPQVRREGPGARTSLPAGLRRRAVGRGHDRHPARPEGALRGAPRCAHPGLGARQRGRAVRPLHHEPVPARQGDRPRRRGGLEAAHRDRLAADRDRRRPAAHHAARDRAARAREGDRPRLGRAARRAARRARHAQRRQRADARALGAGEAGDRCDPLAQGGARAAAHPGRARDRSRRRRRDPLRPHPRAGAAHRRGHGAPRRTADRASGC